MRLIDADVLKQHIDKLPALPDGNFAGNHSALKALINMQPAIEPELIRCKDCLMHGVCRFEQGLGLDGYCSQAERRNDD